MLGRQKTIRKIFHASRQNFVVVHQDVAGQVWILTSQCIVDPCTLARIPCAIATRVEEQIADRVQR